MRYNYKPSFDRRFRKLSRRRQRKVFEAIRILIDFFESGEQPSKGIGLKRLRADYWEIRADIKDRILFRFADDVVEFIIVGNHNECSIY